MDRRTVWAILIMMVIAIAPALLIKRPTPKVGSAAGARDTSATTAAPTPSAPPAPAPADSLRPDTVGGAPRPSAEDTVRVSSPLYTYGFSTRGGRLVEATLARYRSMDPAERGHPAQIIPPGSNLLGLTLVIGRDSVPLADWPFTVQPNALRVNGPGELRLSATRGAVTVDLTYAFQPDDYRVAVSGRVTGVGPNGGQLLIGMGPTLGNTEANEVENHRALALVTKQRSADRIDFASLKTGEPRTVSGPLEWVAVKSKYFVTAVFGFDSTGGAIGGVAATGLPSATEKHPISADVRLSLPVPPSGAFEYGLYAGPMEYDRLSRIGHDFDDVNPYGWPGFRTIIRPVAVAVRWLLVWMHEHLHLAYGLVLVFFGVLVRVLLWPLNQKAMRANMQLQAVQPLMKDIQERYKNDPQKLQQEMFKLYKEHSVNPLGGCWPMLLPM
ncbi:MAG: membrane protein insertase YidC, partial [Gemmatimonadales bacterium]